MKSIRLLLLISAAFIMSTKAEAEIPKYEMRAGWIYTVWNLDWPTSTINVAASEETQARQRAQQQQRLIFYLDKLHIIKYYYVNTRLF